MKRSNLFSNFLFIFSYLVIFLFFLEIVSRAFFWHEFRVKPSDLIYKYYPQLHQLDGTKYEKNYYDILFLGASVIASGWEDGGVQTVLGKVLAKQTGRNIRIFNLATPAHSTLDSYYKYKQLIDRKFDLVLIYDSINETRANNCPLNLFKKDYSHYAWYEELNILESHKEIKFLVFPFLIHRLAVRVWRLVTHFEYVPKIYPKKEWIHYGADIKTKECFRNNLEKILTIAHLKQEKVLLMTFAYFVPEDYSFEKFKDRQLAYTFLGYSAPIEEWGDPANVIKGIEVHNKVIKELADQDKEVLFVDQANLMPRSGAYFRDICHLTPMGFYEFVGNISPVIIKSMALSNGA